MYKKCKYLVVVLSFNTSIAIFSSFNKLIIRATFHPSWASSGTYKMYVILKNCLNIYKKIKVIYLMLNTPMDSYTGTFYRYCVLGHSANAEDTILAGMSVASPKAPPTIPYECILNTRHTVRVPRCQTVASTPYRGHNTA